MNKLILFKNSSPGKAFTFQYAFPFIKKKKNPKLPNRKNKLLSMVRKSISLLQHK